QIGSAAAFSFDAVARSAVHAKNSAAFLNGLRAAGKWILRERGAGGGEKYANPQHGRQDSTPAAMRRVAAVRLCLEAKGEFMPRSRAPEGFSLAPASLAAARACSTRVPDAARSRF